MKKSLVLAMAMALGVTASAYAANPFSDVPAGHWAYDSVAKLAAAGVVDGYGDGTYGGDKLMTRYEMAQIVARAMANGANVDKLAAEFADELDALGVRVAALEKKADNVKITGQIRYNYADTSGDLDGSASKLRSRIWIKGAVNEDWTYTGMLENIQNFRNDAGDETTNFQRAYVEGKLGGLKVTAGRYNYTDPTEGNIYDSRFDGISVSYGKDVKLTVYGGKPTNQANTTVFDSTMNGYLKPLKGADTFALTEEFGEMYGANLDAKIGVVNATIGYTMLKDGKDTLALTNGTTEKTTSASIGADDHEILDLGFSAPIAKDLNLSAYYLRANSDAEFDDDKDGYVIGLNYKGAKASKPGTYGVFAKYYDQAKGTYVAHTMNGDPGTWGFKGYLLGANYAFAKNIVGQIEYYDLEDKLLELDRRTLWTQLVFTF